VEATTATRSDVWIDGNSDDRRAIGRVFAGLERGFDEHDADAFNRSFAHDVIWGSPYGGTGQRNSCSIC
jgi:hypothetical protein